MNSAQFKQEPVGFLRFTSNNNVKFIKKDEFKLEGASPMIINVDDLPVFIVPQTSDVEDKLKIELQEKSIELLDQYGLVETRNSDLAKADAKLKIAIEALQSILDGTYHRDRDVKCADGKFSWEDCEQCIERHVMQALEKIGEQKL